MKIETRRCGSPLGPLYVAVQGGVLRALAFEAEWPALCEALVKRHPSFTWTEGAGADAVARRLDAYFEGDLHALEELPALPEGTPFQRRVWSALRDIPPGVTRTYADVAASIGAPQACRAVGAANGRNPISLVIPCHRVIGSGGALVGYAGGLSRKRRLLEHERALRA